MAYNISNFIQSIGKSGVLHTNKFEVNFISPKVMQGTTITGPNSAATNSDIEDMVRFRAETAKVPGVLLESADVNRYGVGSRQKMPFNATFTDTNITFISDRDGDIYRYFYTWVNSTFDFSGSIGSGDIPGTNRFAQYAASYKDDYTTDLIINVYDTSGNIAQSIVMWKAFPISFNEVNLGWAQQNELFKISVSFSFRDWTAGNVFNSNRNEAPPVSYPAGYQTAVPTPQQKPITPAPDPTQNFLNDKGNFNSPYHKDGTQLPTFAG